MNVEEVQEVKDDQSHLLQIPTLPLPLQKEFPPTFATTLYSVYDAKEDENGYKGTILSFVIRNALSEFRDQAKKRIEKQMNQPPVRTDEFSFLK